LPDEYLKFGQLLVKITAVCKFLLAPLISRGLQGTPLLWYVSYEPVHRKRHKCRLGNASITLSSENNLADWQISLILSTNLELLLKSGQRSVNNYPLILAVDDDQDNLLLLSEVLKSMNCTFMTATHGQTAIFLAQDCQPDLILLDVMLPDFNGMEVVQRLRQNQQTNKIPIIAITALARVEDRERLLSAGFDDYISKPYMIDDLEELIGRYLSRISSIA